MHRTLFCTKFHLPLLRVAIPRDGIPGGARPVVRDSARADGRGASVNSRLRCSLLFAFLLSTVYASFAQAEDPMRLVGSLVPWPSGQFGAVVVNVSRGVAYMGSLKETRGVAVIDMRDRAHPVVTAELAPPNTPNNLSTSYDVDLVGRYLLVAHHQALGLNAFVGVSVYDISADPFHPTLLRRIPVPASCGLESAELDPEVESGRPYAYCNAHCFINGGMYTVNILTGEVLSRYVSSEPLNCPPFPCAEENLPHEAFVQRHPTSGHVLVYIGYWDSGLRIADVTDPRNPVEVGSFDYGTGTPYQNAHGAVATPSGNWVYVGDELGSNTSGGVHVFDAHSCDGTSYCTPTQVGFWHASGHNVQDPNNSGFPDYFRFDVHNMDPHGENSLILGNYGLGVRLIDMSVKAAPEEISFYLPNSSGQADLSHPELYVGRRTWVALFGSDGLVYASDINLGFFIISLNPHTVLPAGAGRFKPIGDGDAASAGAVPADFRFSSGAYGSGSHSVTFTMKRDGLISLTIYDAAGRRVASVARGYATTGTHTLRWDGRVASGRQAPNGLYFARLSTPDGDRSGKLVHLIP